MWPKIYEEVHQAPRSPPSAATPKEIFASDGQLLCQGEETWGDAGWLSIRILYQLKKNTKFQNYGVFDLKRAPSPLHYYESVDTPKLVRSV